MRADMDSSFIRVRSNIATGFNRFTDISIR